MRVCLFLLVGLLFVSAAQAHTRSYSYSQWDLSSSPYQLTVRVNQYDLTRLNLHPEYTEDYSQRVISLVQSQLIAKSNGEACEWDSTSLSHSSDGWVNLRAGVLCVDEGSFSVTSNLLLDAVSSHMHFVSLHGLDGGMKEKVLIESDNEWRLDDKGSSADKKPSNLANYWLLGSQHILSGWDHLAFVFGLLLLATTVGQLAWLITGFTIAHSMTLALAALGQVQPVGSAVEAMIGLSILLVALEFFWEREGKKPLLPLLMTTGLLILAIIQPNGLPAQALLGMALFVACYFAILKNSLQAARWRLLIAFAFGLFHGFGFAGILADMSLPSERLLPALFGFNLGVESGQLLVVAVLWPVLGMLHDKLPIEQWGATAIAGLGTFWFITRAFI